MVGVSLRHPQKSSLGDPQKKNKYGTYFTHVRDNVRVQSATEWTASVHTLHMSAPVITSLFKVLWNGLPRCILDTCPHL